MASGRDLHIMPGDRGWKVLRSDDPQPLGTTDTREDAVRLADHMHRTSPGIRRIFIHGEDQTVHERTSLGHRDPFPGRRGPR